MFREIGTSGHWPNGRPVTVPIDTFEKLQSIPTVRISSNYRLPNGMGLYRLPVDLEPMSRVWLIYTQTQGRTVA